ncbi:di-heme-cytochrome C peroxidase [soil metagenome]
MRLIFFSFILVFTTNHANAQTALRLEQGWNDSDREAAYTLYEGSQIMPLRWFSALEMPGSQSKLIDNVAAYGLVPNELVRASSGLPMGLTGGEDLETGALYGETKWVGLNCTACHSGLLEISGKKVLIEGGQGLFDIQKFENDINASVSATLVDTSKLERLARSLGGANTKSLEKNLKLFAEEFGGWTNRNHHLYDSNQLEILNGPGRMDGLGGGTNDLLCHMTDRMGVALMKNAVTDPANCESAQPAVSLPHLWGIPHQDFVQWNGAVHASLGRNYGQSTATYGKNWVEIGAGLKPRMRSTANVEGLFALEKLYEKLESPRWTQLVALGIAEPLKADRVERGNELFIKNCVSCHAIQPESTAPNSFGNSYWKVSVTAQADVGTDSAYLAANGARRAVIPWALRSYFRNLFGDSSIDSENKGSAADFRSFTIGALILQYFDLHSTTPEVRTVLTNCRDSSFVQRSIGLKSRSLEGVIFTAPFLHNGSVPTLADLLEPANKRPKQFYVGCRKYDLAKVGYDCDASNASFVFDTTQYTNGNAGHEYGTRLSSESKLDVIEFMKSLNPPALPSPQNPACH